MTNEQTPIENNAYFQYAGGNGRQNEGTVASFLYDLFDPANEPHDIVQYPGRYIADIIKTCDVTLGSWIHNQDIAHTVFCFERWIDPATASQLSPLPASYRESALEPPAWNRGAIRMAWMKNLFNQ